MARPVVVCPLQFELRELRRHGVGRRAGLARCGLGGAGVRAWAARFTPRVDAPRVILAGTAGGLRGGAATGSAYAVSEVVDQTGRRWPTAWPPPSGVRTAIVLHSETVLTTSEEKRRAGERFGAELVDMESGVFAEIATARGWHWAVVRGVSDDADAVLPADIGAWLHPGGRLRPLRIARSLARHPTLLGPALRVQAGGRRALRSVAEVVVRLLDLDE
jgi:adenosylhomocysteine nucleosidase